MAYHAQDGLFFTRLSDGGVAVEFGLEKTALTPEAWASVVASMSAKGETAETWRDALDQQTP